MKRSSNDSKASQTEVLVASVDNQAPEQNIPKNVNSNGMSSQRVQYYQCPCCKCGNSHYQQLVSGSIPGSCCPASVAYEVPQRLSTIEENDIHSRKSYDQNDNEYYRNINNAPYGEPQKRNGLDEDEDDPNCICPRDQTPPRQVPLPPLYQQQQQQPQQPQQQRNPCSCRTCDCCVSCGRTIRPYRDNGTATGSITSRGPTPKICLPKCPGTCNPNRLMQVDEEVMVVPTYETKEVTANTMKEKPCRGSVRASQQSSGQFDRYRPRSDYRSNCERCCGRYDDRYDDRYDGRYNDRRDNFCGDKYCRGSRDDRYSDQNGGRNEVKNPQYNEFDEICYCDPTCDPQNPACGTCTDIVAQEEKEIVPYKKESQNTIMTNQDSHVRSHTCHVDPVCSLCDMDQFSEKSRPIVVDRGVNTMPVKKKCSLFKSKK